MYVRNGGALILQLHIRHAGDAGTARAQFVKLLSYVAILPWVHSPCLASRILSGAIQPLLADWSRRYGYRPVLLETFVESSRFKGTSYKAANWICVGQTQGRGKLEKHHRQACALKQIWLYPLHPLFRKILCA